MKIDSYSFGRIVVEGKTFTEDVVIFSGKIKSHWWRKQGHVLRVEDVDDVYEEHPDVIVVGTGANGRMKISQKVKEKLGKEGIELKAAKTEKACTLYNKLSKHRKVVAALHLTC